MYGKTLLSMSIMAALAPVANAKSVAYLDEVVVSATRSAQAKKEVSAAIATESRQELDLIMAHDLAEAFRYTPGVHAEVDGRFGLSGFNIRGVDGSRVKTMIDGVQQPVPYNPGANEQRSYPNAIEIDTLQAIEINKGPASTLYGSDAIGGAVLLKTKDPADVLITEDNEHRFGLKTSYTSVDKQFKNTLTWAMRQDQLETLVMATYAKGHETKTHGSGADIEGPGRGAANPADSDLGNVLAKAYYQINDEHRVGATLEYYQKKYDEDELSDNGYSIMPGFTYTDNYNEDNRKRLRLGVEHQWQLDSGLADTAEWSANYQDSESIYKNYDTTEFNGARQRQRDASDRTWQADVQLEKWLELGQHQHQVTYGANFIHNDFQLDNTDYKFSANTATPGNTGLPDADLTSWGIFAQDQLYFLDDKLVVTAGARYDSYKATPGSDAGYENDFDKNQDDALTLKLGSVYHFNDNLSVYGQVSQGFKAPTVEDLYYFYDMGAVFNPNPNLKAEKSVAYELGLRGQNNSTSFELATFYTDYSDFITDVVVGQEQGGQARDIITKQNLDDVTIYGAEFSSTVNLDKAFAAPEGVYSRFSIAYAKGEDKKTGRSLDSVAPLTAVIGLGLDREQYGGVINLTMTDSKSDWQTADHNKASGYSLVDITSYYRPTPDITLRAGLFNVLDKKYWVYNEVRDTNHSVGGSARDTQPGRNWGLSVDYQF